MSKFTDIRDYVRDRISTIADIGQVHDYERYASLANEMQALYTVAIGSGKQLRGWYVRRRSRQQAKVNMQFLVDTTWEIRGIMALNDAAASEKVMQDQIELMVHLFNADPNLGGKVNSMKDGESYGLQLTDFGPVSFAGVTCHMAVIRFKTQHYE